jgi:hypothetical protein
VSSLTIDQALDSRDAIAKIIYSNLFTWLVQRVNRIVFKGEANTSINVLDIFGFENFKVKILQKPIKISELTSQLKPLRKTASSNC